MRSVTLGACTWLVGRSGLVVHATGHTVWLGVCGNRIKLIMLLGDCLDGWQRLVLQVKLVSPMMAGWWCATVGLALGYFPITNISGDGGCYSG